MTEETGWVIVIGVAQLSYWNGGVPGHGSFSSDNAKAVRFARKEDAEAVIAAQDMSGSGLRARAEDHMWCDYL